MPKKTKLQKKRADSRRQLFTQPNTVVHKELVSPIKESEPQKPDRQIENVYKPTDYDMTLKSLTLSDLKKTAAITVLLFALEFLVFYAKLRDISFGR